MQNLFLGMEINSNAKKIKSHSLQKNEYRYSTASLTIRRKNTHVENERRMTKENATKQNNEASTEKRSTCSVRKGLKMSREDTFEKIEVPNI